MTIQTAVVTGGAGFLGSHMVDLLVSQGFRVRVVDNLSSGQRSNLLQHARGDRIDLEEIDVLDLEPACAVFEGARFVFHFAGIADIVPSLDQPLEYMKINGLGTAKVLECARHARVEKFVYAASSSCFGIAEVPTREDHPMCPEYPYALSKYQGELAALHWHRAYGLPAISMRIFNAYGTRSRSSGAYGAVLGVFLRQKLAGQPFTVVGDGSQQRDFVFATDVASAFLKAAEKARGGECFNLGSGRPQTINRLVALLGGPKVSIPSRPGEPPCTWADTSKIRTELAWVPRVSFEDGVSQVLDRIDDWRDAPLWDAESIRSATRGWFEALGREAESL